MLISTSRVNSFKDNKIARARWANAICSLWKTYKRLFTPNCKRNHSITHYGSDNNDNNNKNKNVNTRFALKDCISQFWDTKTIEMNLSFQLRTFRLEIIIIVIITIIIIIIIIINSSSSSIVVVGSCCTCYNFVILKEYLLINFLSFADVITKAPSTIKTTTTTASTTTTISTPGLLLKDCILQFWHIKTVEMNLGFHMPTFWL